MLKMRNCIVALSVFLAIFTPALAEEVFVGNQPFRGHIVGTGNVTRLGLDDLASELKSVVRKVDGTWTLDGFEVDATEENGVVWVKVETLPTELVRLVRSRELNTLDIYKLEPVATAKDEEWGDKGTLVCFYAAWSPACRAMNTTLAVLQRTRTLQLRILDIDRPGSSEFRRYARYFSGDKIPYFVVVDNQGRQLHAFSGFKSYNEVLVELKTAFAEKS